MLAEKAEHCLRAGKRSVMLLRKDKCMMRLSYRCPCGQEDVRDSQCIAYDTAEMASFELGPHMLARPRLA